MNIKKRLQLNFVYAYASAGFMIAFMTCALVVKMGAFDTFDTTSIVLIQQLVPKQFDVAFSTLSLIGSFEVLVILLAVLLFLRNKTRTLLVLSIFFVGHIIEFAGKYFLYHPGPPYMYFRYNIPFLFPTSGIQPGSSFPSGHSYRSLFIAVIIAFMVYHLHALPKYVKVLLYSITALVVLIILISRVSLGEHWTSDVIGGSFLGASFAFLSLVFL